MCLEKMYHRLVPVHKDLGKGDLTIRMESLWPPIHTDPTGKINHIRFHFSPSLLHLLSFNKIKRIKWLLVFLLVAVTKYLIGSAVNKRFLFTFSIADLLIRIYYLMYSLLIIHTCNKVTTPYIKMSKMGLKELIPCNKSYLLNFWSFRIWLKRQKIK